MSNQHPRGTLGLVAIGALKLFKSALLAGLGALLLYDSGHGLSQSASQWINSLWLPRPYLDRLLARLSSIDERALERVAIGSFIYAILLLIEGIGLCCRQRWAEFLTVAITASLLPLELYELSHHPTATAAVVTLLNIAILAYLIRQLILDRPRP